MNSKVQKVMIGMFIITIVFFSLSYLIKQDQKFSEYEKRYLTQKPILNAETFLKGDFTKKMESYLQDQVVFRKQLMKTYAYSKKLLLQLENNGVFFGKDNYWIEQPRLFDTTSFEKSVAAINAFPYPMQIMIVPTLAQMQKDLLPWGAYASDQIKLLSLIQTHLDTKHEFLDVSKVLQGRNDAYFKSDHHWNAIGAQLAAQFYATHNQIKYNKVELTPLISNFQGTMSAQIGMFDISYDVIHQMEELKNINVTVTMEDNTTTNSLFFDKHLQESDPYMYYLDGNHALVSIVNQDKKEGKNLLVIKDSYAHIFVPYLVPYYKHIYMIDLRYYKDSISKFIQEYAIDQTLFLYNMKEFFESKNIQFLK